MCKLHVKIKKLATRISLEVWMSHVKELSVIKDFDMFGNGNFSVSFLKFLTKWKVVFPIMLVNLDFSGQCPLDIHFYLKSFKMSNSSAQE